MRVAPASLFRDAARDGRFARLAGWFRTAGGGGGVSPQRMASPAAERIIMSGHSLTDAWLWAGPWPGHFRRIRESLYGGAAGVSIKSTIPGSSIQWRWDHAPDAIPGESGDARADIAGYDLLTITEAGPPILSRPWVPAERPAVAETLAALMLFVARARSVGAGGAGAEVMLQTINTWPAGVAAWGGAPFRAALVQYERVFHHMADYAAWRMRQAEPGLPADHAVWILPCHRWWMRVWDDLQTGAVPGVAALTDLFIDEIHPNGDAGYGLACLAAAVIHQVEPAATPGFHVPAGMSAAWRDYCWTIAWEIATTYRRAGLGGADAGEPGWDPAIDVDLLATPVSVATPAAISPTSGAVGTTLTLTPPAWAGTAPFTTTLRLYADGVDVTAGIVDAGGVLTYAAGAAAVYELVCAADNMARQPAASRAAAGIGVSLVPEDALVVVTPEAVAGPAWSPALPAAALGHRALGTSDHGVTAGAAIRYALAVVRMRTQPSSLPAVLAIHAQPVWWSGSHQALQASTYVNQLLHQGQGASGGSQQQGLTPPLAPAADWIAVEMTNAGAALEMRVGESVGTLALAAALSGQSRFSLIGSDGLLGLDLAALVLMDRIPDAGELTLLRVWAEGQRSVALSYVPPEVGATTGGSATSGSGAFADYVAGDLLLAHVATIALADLVIPAGWTAIAPERDDEGATSILCWRRATSNGADTLGDWGSGRPRYLRIRGAHPTAPIRQTAFAATASGTPNVAYPALPAPLSGNSVVVTATHLRNTAADLAPGTRADCTQIYARLGAGGLHGAVAVSGRPAPGTWEAAVVATTTGGSAGGAHSWAIEIEGLGSSDDAFDVEVSTRAAALAAAAAAPANLGRRYVIQLAAGLYGYMTVPAGDDKGTTRVVFRAAPGAQALFRGINASDVANVAFEHLAVVGDTLDAFGFPGGSASSSRGILLTRSTNCRVWGCLVEDMGIGIEANGSTDVELGWNTIRSFAIDGLRLYELPSEGRPVVRPHVHHNVIDVNATTPKWPNLATLGLHYALPPTCAVDPRRSDQAGYGNADSYVQPVSGAPILVTENTKLGRHADCAQLAGQSVDAVIEDNDFITSNIYCHGIFTDNGPTESAEPTSGLIIRRNRFNTAHVNAICAEGWDASCRVEDCLIRAQPVRTWALGMPDGSADNPDLMRPSISTRKNVGALVRIVNTVCPAEVSTYWMQTSRISSTGLVYSDSATPVGWSSTDVAQGRVGHLHAPD